MEEELSRVKKNQDLYSDYDTIFNLLWIIGVILCLFLTIVYWFSPLNAKALTEYDITTSIYTVSECEPSLTSQQGYCAADDNVYNDVWSRVSLGSNHAAGDNVRSIGFKVNTGIGANKRVTIQLKGARYNNVSYYCHNVSVDCNVVFVDNSQLNINFTTGDSPLTYSEFRIYANNNNTFNGRNLFYISQVKLLTNDVSSGGSSGGSSGSTFDDSGIINRANQNTSDIIRNNNTNTQSIIDSINQGLFKDCTNLFNYNEYYSKSGDLQFTPEVNGIKLTSTNTWQNIIYRIPIQNGKNYYFKGRYQQLHLNQVRIALSYSGSNPSDVFNGDIWFSGDTSVNGSWSTSFTSNRDGYVYVGIWASLGNEFFANNNASLFQMMFDTDNNPFCPFGEGINYLDSIHGAIQGGLEENKNAIDENTEAVRDVNDTLTDDNVDSGVGADFFNDFDTTDPGGISTIVTKPLVIVNNLLSNNNSCVNLTLPSFMGVSNAYLPSGCILWDHAPSSVITLWNIFTCGLGSYYILKQLFKLVEDLKNPDNDRVEVMDL